MSEIINDKKVFSLIDVTRSIRKTMEERYTSSFWVKAEMNKLNHYVQSGHCYPELVEKQNGKVVAQMKCILWKNDFLRINEKFIATVKEPIKDGIKILFCGKIEFDPVHGLSLNILDIDPNFSLGELEREKQETIEKLRQEGIFDHNKKLALALLPQRIAVISVETSKGYADYLKVLEQNPWRYKFFHLLFPSLLQGEKSVANILYQLRRVKKAASHFDAVAIIRGGGGDIGLSSYNNYSLCREIALFPIPVLTGIGHSTNETVAEMVSFKNAITPTELADFLIQKFHNFSVPVRKAEEIIRDRSARIVKEEKLKFRNMVKFFQSVTGHRLLESKSAIDKLKEKLMQHSKFIIRQEHQQLSNIIQSVKKYPFSLVLQNRKSVLQTKDELQKKITTFIQRKKMGIGNLEGNVHMLDPVNIIRRGFSITLHNGKALKHHNDVRTGDTLTTILTDGKIISDVKESKTND